MENELFCEDYYMAPETKTVKLIEILCTWKKKKNMLYPNDIFNILIDLNFANKFDVEKIISNTMKKSLDLKLPTSYITDS